MKEKNCTANPCYFCMPLGAIFAGFGFEKTITLIHGSQGCATYMRRHMARHFHEPVDAASSSLNEKDAIYGGEENLKKAIKNVHKQYNPKMIVIASTCLSETIGDDVDAIVDQIGKKTDEFNIPLVNVLTPSFQGGYSAGYWRTIKAILKKTCGKSVNNKPFINIIPGIITPQDLRYLKVIGDLWQIDFHILGDYSQTLDGVWSESFKLLPDGGTPIGFLKEAGSAFATIEFSTINSEEYSTGLFLQQEFGVPSYRLPYPQGLETTDKFMNLLKDITERDIPKSILTTRGRLLDAMVDSHKILFGKKVVIFGESDFVYSACQIMEEWGIEVAAIVYENTGTQDTGSILKTKVPMVIDNGSMFELEEWLTGNNVDLLLGSSVGYSLSLKLNIPLVRRGFPIHDRFGAGRILTIMYEGSISLMDDISNVFMEKINSSFRDELKESYLH